MSNKDQILNTIKQVLSDYTGLDVEEIDLHEHLEEDLLLDLGTELPRVIMSTAAELNLNLENEALSSFLADLAEDPDKSTVAELLAFFQEEMDLG